MDWNLIKLMILDVDGVLTNGKITMDADAEVTKSFYVQDGFAIKLWHRSGGQTVILSSRQHPAVMKRATELGIEQVHTGVADKLEGYMRIIKTNGCTDGSVCYVGDDLPDLHPLTRSGFGVAVSNAVSALKRRALYVTRRSGGAGAVAEVVEFLLRKQKKWTRLISCEDEAS